MKSELSDPASLGPLSHSLDRPILISGQAVFLPVAPLGRLFSTSFWTFGCLSGLRLSCLFFALRQLAPLDSSPLPSLHPPHTTGAHRYLDAPLRRWFGRIVPSQITGGHPC